MTEWRIFFVLLYNSIIISIFFTKWTLSRLVLNYFKFCNFHLEDQEFAVPNNYKELLCKGRPCAKCGECRDWYVTGDLTTWNWMRNCNNWKEDYLNRYFNGRIYERFKLRDDATCSCVAFGVGRYCHYGFYYYGDCLCQDNIKSGF